MTPTPRLTSTRGAVLAGATALLLASAAQAHPHGTLDCAVQARVADGRVHTLQLALTLDAASSVQLQPRVQADPAGSAAPAEPAREVRAFRSLLAGLFRQSGWMLQARVEAPDQADSTTPEAWASDWADPDPPQWQQLADGRLQVQVNLQPAGPPLVLSGSPRPPPLDLRCQDSSWYWLARYRQPADVQVLRAPAGAETPVAARAGTGAACQVELDGWQRTADQALGQQAKARQAGAAGADQMAPGLAGDTSRGAARARLRC